MKKYLPLVVLLLTVGFGCEECNPYANWSDWMQQTRQQQQEPETQTQDDYLPLNLSFTANENTSNENITPPTNSILEDLYPEKYQKTTTSLWVNTTDLNINESGTEASWGLQVVEGSATVSSTVPVPDVSVMVQFQGGSGEAEVVGITGVDGWVWWVRSKTGGAEQMYIRDVVGELPWNSLDMAFWQNTPALSITAEETQ